MYIRKTKDEYHVQGYYTGEYRYETVCVAETYKEAKILLKEYNENEPMYPHRIVKKRAMIGPSIAQS